MDNGSPREVLAVRIGLTLMLVGAFSSYLAFLLFPPISRASNGGIVTRIICAALIGGALIAAALAYAANKSGLTKKDASFAGYIMWLPYSFILGGNIYLLNGVLDTSESKVIEARIIYSDINSQRRGRLEYRIQVWDWKNSHNELPLSVERGVYEKYKSQKTVKVVTREGRLGLEWIERVG
jgi:hypothetical protein